MRLPRMITARPPTGGLLQPMGRHFEDGSTIQQIVGCTSKIEQNSTTSRCDPSLHPSTRLQVALAALMLDQGSLAGPRAYLTVLSLSQLQSVRRYLRIAPICTTDCTTLATAHFTPDFGSQRNGQQSCQPSPARMAANATSPDLHCRVCR